MERMLLEFDGKVAVLKFNHPEVLNAIGAQMLEEFSEALREGAMAMARRLADGPRSLAMIRGAYWNTWHNAFEQ